MLFHIDPLRLWVHKVLPVVYDDSLSYYEVLAKVTKKLNEVIDLTDEQNQFIQNFSDNLTNAINNWEEGMERSWVEYQGTLNTEWADFQKNTEQYIENWKNMAESDIEDAIAAGINQFVSYFSGLTQTAVDAAEEAMRAAETAAEDAVDAVMPTLENQFDERYAWKSAVGSPLVATTTAGMTDTTKVYVYVGDETGYVNGDWYYYDGTTWQDGGVYNSAAVVTDPTLSESGIPADAKAAGDEIADLKSTVDDVVEDVDNLIIISPSEPSAEGNKIWIDSNSNSVQIPTMTEFELVKKAALIRKSASGAIAAFSDGADRLALRNITLDSGATTLSKRGKNLFDKTDSNQLIAQSFIGTNAIAYQADRACVTIPCKPNTTYTVSRKRLMTTERLVIAYAKTSVKPKVGDSVYGIVSANASGTVGDTFSATITTGNDATYIVVWAYWSNETSALNDLQIELGSNATSYATFEGNDYTINNGEPTEQVATLYGTNVFWADVGDVSVGYYADTTLALEALQQ